MRESTKQILGFLMIDSVFSLPVGNIVAMTFDTPFLIGWLGGFVGIAVFCVGLKLLFEGPI